MKQINFKPDYGYRRIGAVFLFLIGFFMLCFGLTVTGATFSTWGFGLFLILLCLVSFFAYPKEIVFTQSRIIVKRFLLPKQIFEYQEFTDIGGMMVKFGTRTIPLLHMRNQDEIIEIFQKLFDEQKIQPSQIEGKLIVEDALTQKALKIAIVPGFLGGFALDYLLSTYFSLNLDYRLTFLISFLTSLTGIYIVLKRQHENA